MPTDVTALADPVQEGVTLVDAAAAAGVVLRLIGGVAVAASSPSARTAPLARSYADVDLVGRGGQRAEIEALMARLGYLADETTNLLHGHQRLIFWNAAQSRQVDVFVDLLEMCHTLELGPRLELTSPTLPLADLLLAKLQVYETNARDYGDIATLLVDHELAPGAAIDADWIAELVGGDWGLWRTTTEVAQRTRAYPFAWEPGERPGAFPFEAQVDRLLAVMEDAPKSRGWKLRAKIGERKRWYELPEDMPSEQKDAG